MKTNLLCALCGFLAAVVAFAPGRESGPVTINLDAPGEALLLTLEGKPAGGLRVDADGRLAIFGPNRTSSIITIDSQDRVQIDPEPVVDPPARLIVANDVWLTGVLRVGRADAFGDAPFDPNGAIQLGRNLNEAQPMSLLRAFAQGEEAFRLGTTKEGHGFWSDGAHDIPLLTFRPSGEGDPQSGKLLLYGNELLAP